MQSPGRASQSHKQNLYCIQPLLPERRELLEPSKCICLFRFQHSPMRFTALSDNAFKLLRSNVEPVSVRKDIIFPPLNRKNVKCSKQLSKSDEQTVNRQVRSRTDSPSPSKARVPGFRWVDFLSNVRLFFDAEGHSFIV